MWVRLKNQPPPRTSGSTATSKWHPEFESTPLQRTGTNPQFCRIQSEVRSIERSAMRGDRSKGLGAPLFSVLFSAVGREPNSRQDRFRISGRRSTCPAEYMTATGSSLIALHKQSCARERSIYVCGEFQLMRRGRHRRHLDEKLTR